MATQYRLGEAIPAFGATPYINRAPSGPTKLNTMVRFNGNNYNTYRSADGMYYFEVNGKKNYITDTKTINKLSKNPYQTILYGANSSWSEPTPAGPPAPTTNKNNTTTKKPSSGTGTSTSTKTPSVSATVTTKEPEKKEVPKIDWQNKPIDEMAEILGIENYKTADILAMYNEATNKKFDELDTEVKRYQAENLRALEGNYQTYLNSLRENKANAISNGMTKGAAAAQQLASMIAGAQAVSDSQQYYHDSLYDIAQERGTALAENVITADKDRKAIEQYLGTLRGTYEANSVNELAARLASNSQVQAAQIQADAATKAAGIQAAATKAAATSAQDKVLQYYIDVNGGDVIKGKAAYLNQMQRDTMSNAYNSFVNAYNAKLVDKEDLASFLKGYY